MRLPLCFALLLAGILLAGSACAATLSVAVRETPLRESPSPFGRVVAKLRYAERVESLSRQGAWHRVRSGGASGWLHDSALTERRLALQSGSGQVQAAASAQELTLAGKGFNAQIEQEYRRGHGDLDYAVVDRMERLSLGADELRGFLREGRLAGAGGTP